MSEGAKGDSKAPKTPGPRQTGREDGASPSKKKPRPARPDPTRYGDWEKGGRCIDF